MSFTALDKVLYYFITRVRAINEEEVLMGNPIVNELLSLVLSLVQSHDFLDIPLSKDICVLFRSHSRSLVLISVINWAHEGSKLSWNDPVDVSILYSFIVLVLFDIEGLNVVPVVFNSKVKSLEAMKNSALIITLTL